MGTVEEALGRPYDGDYIGALLSSHPRLGNVFIYISRELRLHKARAAVDGVGFQSSARSSRLAWIWRGPHR